MGAFNTFEENLSLIKERENLVSMGSEDPELRVDGKSQIISDIQMINELLEQNRQIIDDLNAQLSKAERRTPEFRRMIGVLKGKLEEKDMEIASLKEELVAMNYTVESLSTKIDTLRTIATNLNQTTEAQTWRIAEQDTLISSQSKKIDEQIENLNTAYFITGTYKELKAQHVLTKAGGFIGLGGSKELLPDFDESGFIKIDITETQSIPVDTKKAQLMTNHPSDSYVYNQDGKTISSLEITNPERFWKTSRYLVLVTN